MEITFERGDVQVPCIWVGSRDTTESKGERVATNLLPWRSARAILSHAVAIDVIKAELLDRAELFRGG